MGLFQVVLREASSTDLERELGFEKGHDLEMWCSC